MKLYKLFAFNLIVFFLLSAGLKAQKNYSQIADLAFQNHEYSEAISLYKKAYSKVKDKKEKGRIIYQIAECYRITNNPEDASKWYERTMGKYSDNIIYYRYAEMLRMLQRYGDAIKQYQLYQEKVPNDPKGKLGQESCELALKWKDNPTRYQVKEMKAFNSRQSDYSTFFIDQKKFTSLVFTSGRESSLGSKTDAWTGESFTDIYTVRKDKKGQWSSPASIGKPINTELAEGAPCYNRQGTEIYFTRCPREKKKQMNCQIFKSTLVGNDWGEPKLLNLVPDSFTVGHPFISDDELSIYFSSDFKPGNYGGHDLWVAKRLTKNDEFGKPENLGTNINTSGDDMFPYIRSNGDLFYASNGLPGMGGFDIYKAVKKGDGWDKPVNMLPPINSSADDFAIIFMNEEERGYFSTSRNGKSSDDIFYFWLPNLLFTLSGVVKDDSTLLPIPEALVKVTDSDGKMFEGKTDNDGAYKFDTTQILPNKTYKLLFSKDPQYFAKAGQSTTVGLEESKDLVLNMNLTPIPKKPIVLPDILYDLDKWDLKPQFQDSLNGLYQTLTDNPKIVIELSSHTDPRATDQYNDTLSQRRAQSVVDYLINKGIDKDRMVAKGYGESMPRVLNVNKSVTVNGKKFTFKKGTVLNEAYINKIKDPDQKEAAYYLDRRTEFKVLHQNYVPKTKIEEQKKE